MQELQIHLESVFTGDGEPIINIEGFQPSPHHMGDALKVLLLSKQREEAEIVNLPLEEMSAFELLATLGELAAVRRHGCCLADNERYVATASMEAVK